LRGDNIQTRDLTNKKNLLLLVQLRWIAVGGQVVTILYVHNWLGIDLPLNDMGAVIAFLLALNLISLIRQNTQDTVSNTELFIELLLDIAALTMQLYLSGGASNPFISLFLLQVILGAVLLEAWSVWVIVAVTSLAFVFLTTRYRDIAIPHAHAGDMFNLHIQGMFICFLLAAVLLVFFITRIQHNLRARDARLANLHQRSVEENHIVRMGLLASGAAHELGTPLSTMSVILGDWQRLPAVQGNTDLSQEVGEMQVQVDRCKTIVSGILMSSGEARGEGTVISSVNNFMDGIVAEWRRTRSPRRLDYVNAFGQDEAIVSDAALKQIMFNVFDNALEASSDWLGIDVTRQRGDLIITVRDSGPGFSEAMLEGFGKPYQSSKGRPGGGLGLFLVVNVVRKLGGTASVANREEGGAQVILTLPLNALSPGNNDAA
jgi:two-component system sensor histidine kinase RegB